MSKVSFTVSARAARLIGKENVATSQGAVTELVKNAYDADAQACAVLFLPRYNDIPKSLSALEFEELAVFLQKAEEFFSSKGEVFELIEDLNEEQLDRLRPAVGNILDLWIVDNGHGMSVEVINEKWMVIGTPSKELNDRSVGGRVVTGAKGIGRFALDRLGQECEFYSAEKAPSELVHWMVDWGEFEGAGKTIGDVEAVLEVEAASFFDSIADHNLNTILPQTAPDKNGAPSPIEFQKGTAIKISRLHDKWDQRDSKRLKETLEALLPPRDQREFNIYVYDHRSLEDSGWIENFPPDHFDYKLEATVNSDGTVDVGIVRNEIDYKKISDTVFTIPAMQKKPFTKDDFRNGSITYSSKLKDVVRLEKDEELSDYLAIGPFSFTLYFFKLQSPNTDVLRRYPQKTFDATKRKRWLKSSGGIRLYRDDFRVRPYGEPGTQGSDWLLLGQRRSGNPAAASRIGWRVPPQQVAGTIHITKDENPLLGDQSNREGIMNERAFSKFRDIVIGLVSEFERDRAYAYHHFEKAFSIDSKEEATLEEGRRIADQLLKDAEEQDETDDLFPEADDQEESRGRQESHEDAETVAAALGISEKRRSELKDDLQVMRGMATLGTVLVSFTHELKQIKANLGARSPRMKGILDRVVDEAQMSELPAAASPYNLLDRWEREDEKISRWVDFALSAVSPKKRRRREVEISSYLEDVSEYWRDFLTDSQVTMNLAENKSNDLKLLAHEIDLDSIFYNLIVNSIEAFWRPGGPEERVISISAGKYGADNILIEYQDNGPGISDAFGVPEDIFIYGESVKAEDGLEGGLGTGTGIGMWLLKGIVDDYDGSIQGMSAIGEVGFKISISLPIHKKET